MTDRFFPLFKATCWCLVCQLIYYGTLYVCLLVNIPVNKRQQSTGTLLASLNCFVREFSCAISVHCPCQGLLFNWRFECMNIVRTNNDYY